MIRVVTAVLATLLLLPAWAGEVVTLGQQPLLDRMAAGQEDLLILDVRTPQEFDAGHVPGALNIPYDELESRLAEIEADRGADVVVYCRSGRRADIALSLLEKAGFPHLYHLEGDYQAWAAADRPAEKAVEAEPARP